MKSKFSWLVGEPSVSAVIVSACAFGIIFGIAFGLYTVGLKIIIPFIVVGAMILTTWVTANIIDRFYFKREIKQ